MSSYRFILTGNHTVQRFDIKRVYFFLLYSEKVFYILNQVGSCQRSIVLRPFISKDFMTGVAAIPGNHIPVEVVNQIADEISKVCKIKTHVEIIFLEYIFGIH